MNDDHDCEIDITDETSVKEVKSKMLDNKVFLKISEDFKIFSDPTRVKILYALSKRDLCVCDLASLLEMTHSAVSHQLRIMRNSNLVKFKKVGKNVYYSLRDEHINIMLKIGIEHANESIIKGDKFG
jgi:ArsR family transcriptional regulator, lead/cadmium/zinc/bismuth-responsive transcriptional repressor